MSGLLLNVTHYIILRMYNAGKWAIKINNYGRPNQRIYIAALF